MVRFRERHPTYQREWRTWRSLRKIRDAIEPVLRATERPLSQVIERSTALATVRARDHGTARIDQRDRLADLLTIARRLLAIVRELALLLRQLDDAADRYSVRDTRAD